MKSEYSSSKNVIIIGCGFLGKATASLFLSHGYHVFGIARNPISLEDFSVVKQNLHILRGDVTNQASLKSLTSKVPSNALLIYAVSSGKGGADIYSAVYRNGLMMALDIFKPSRVIFVGSTSVYAQVHGELVTEDSTAEPERETGKILLESEKIALARGGIVARLSGIYGPGRSILLQKFLENQAVLEAGGNRWINQIHRDDAAMGLFYLAQHSTPSGIYNVTDNTPASQREVYTWIANYFQKPLPPEGPANYNRKRGWTSKRISNKKLCSLGWKPAFPSYKHALPLLLAK